jgi:putative PIN family toxin of toxin-antitoxin system
VRVVLDTNVVVSGLLSEVGPPGLILDLLTAGKIVAVHDARILAEYREVLARRRLRLPAAAIDGFLGYVERRGLGVIAPPWPIRLADAADETFLAVAALAQAPLVTGNLRHFPPRVRERVEVLSPRDFLDCWPRA